jgi:hypothetical protein
MRSRLLGSSLLETALFLPLLITLLVGAVELARLTYTYYTLHKILYTIGRYVATQPDSSVCDPSGNALTIAKNLGLYGNAEGSGLPLVGGLTPDMIAIRAERRLADSVEECACDASGCDSSAGGRSPDFIAVFIPDGYRVRPVIPYAALLEFPLRPSVRIPYSGL